MPPRNKKVNFTYNIFSSVPNIKSTENPMIKQRLLLENAERKRLLKNAELKLLNEQSKRFEEKRQNAKEAMNLVRKEEENAKARRIANAEARRIANAEARRIANAEARIFLKQNNNRESIKTNQSLNKITNDELNSIKRLLQYKYRNISVLNSLKNKNMIYLKKIRELLEDEEGVNTDKLYNYIEQNIK